MTLLRTYLIPENASLPSQTNSAFLSEEDVLQHQVFQIMDLLSQFSTYTIDIMTQLSKNVQETTKKTHELSERIKKIKTVLAATEKKMILESAHPSMFITAYPIKMDQYRNVKKGFGHLTPETRPTHLLQHYETCSKPPNLHELDKYRDDGLASINFYSYPAFFVDEWKKLTEKDNEERRKRKLARKQAKKALKNDKKETSTNLPLDESMTSELKLSTNFQTLGKLPLSGSMERIAMLGEQCISEPIQTYSIPSTHHLSNAFKPASQMDTSLNLNASSMEQTPSSSDIPPPPPPPPPSTLHESDIELSIPTPPPPPPPPPFSCSSSSFPEEINPTLSLEENLDPPPPPPLEDDGMEHPQEEFLPPPPPPPPLNLGIVTSLTELETPVPHTSTPSSTYTPSQGTHVGSPPQNTLNLTLPSPIPPPPPPPSLAPPSFPSSSTHASKVPPPPPPPPPSSMSTFSAPISTGKAPPPPPPPPPPSSTSNPSVPSTHVKLPSSSPTTSSSSHPSPLMSITAMLSQAPKLRPTPPREPRPLLPTSNRDTLLSKIREGGFQLRPVDPKLLTDRPSSSLRMMNASQTTATKHNDVAAILLRRAAIELSDSEDDEDEEEEEEGAFD